MTTAWIGLACVCGFLLPFQAGANAEMARHAGGRFQGALANFAVGWVLLALIVLATRGSWPTRAALGAAPWWAWLGGAIGASYVAMTVFVAPRLGGVLMLGVAIVGQLVGSLVVDHFGLVGFPVREVTPGRAAGVVLLLGGAAMVRYL